ncbi:hypothetical protein [Bacteroides reticulotermitis]|uniref:Uncharacterized protein n=1 Tax=Bacteroides reticulotermitis TaxID=1133319 RepID=A0A840D642_9BACE|nr:hypothetical protein [Bacteroides reticulotermitis]MBB4046451.1 hypothetical protein [Bacteroides reticulotermitis]
MMVLLSAAKVFPAFTPNKIFSKKSSSFPAGERISREKFGVG